MAWLAFADATSRKPQDSFELLVVIPSPEARRTACNAAQHTLGAVITATEKLIGWVIERGYLDKGYRAPTRA